LAKFINITTGVTETPHNNSVIEQYRKKTELYKELQENIASDNIPHKNISECTLKELKEQADMLGLEYNKRAKKDEILALLGYK